MKRGKKYREAFSKVDREALYTYEDALSLVKELAFAKFDETIEMAVNLNLKKSHTVRDTVVLPNQFSGEKKVLVFAKGEKAAEAEAAGAAYVGAEELVEKIKGGWLDFDVCVATPDMMREVGKLGPVLGRRGLMPNPKTRTVTMDIKGAIDELKMGRVEYRADKTGVVHLPVGKVSMDPAKVKENIDVFMSELVKKRPSDVKGDFIKTAAVSSTMGPGVRVAVSAN
ncbi:MAG: 50S ribosomal protein L1 [Spirochaetales bacterium]|nr:50S ribosomal protein L1 [Spirochaetales bacterium]